MKNTALKRSIFVALLLVLIVGTILGHADVARADQNQVGITGESSVALTQTMNEMAKRAKVPGNSVPQDGGGEQFQGPLLFPFRMLVLSLP